MIKSKYKRNYQATVVCTSLLFMYLLLGSCKKIVDAGSPLTTITTDQTFSRDGSANAAIAGLYSLMMNGSSTNLIFSNGALTFYGGMSADELINYSGIGEQADYNFSINKLDSQNPIIQNSFWTPQYKLIFNANSMLEGIAASTSNQLTAGTRKQLAAEAKFIRAFSYFYLVNLFGDVPLVLTTDWKVNAQLKRSPAAEVYQQILKDLTEAQSDLLDNYTIGGGERIRANKFVATALLARVYLYTRDWKNAEIQASLILDNNQFGLEEDLRNVFLATSREAIWQLKPASSAPNTQFEVINFTPQTWWASLTDDEKPLYLSFFPEVGFLFYPKYVMSAQLSAAFEADDQRFKIWTNYVDTPTDPPYTGVAAHFSSKYAGTFGVEIGKRYLTVFRVAEQLLIRAEARANLNDLDGADKDLNKVRRRAGLLDITSGSVPLSLQAIAHERRTELFAEWGHRWLDLKRTGKASEVLSTMPSKVITTSQLLYPIPEAEILADPNLVQNLGY